MKSGTRSSVQIGRCGTLCAHPGFYVYVGGALGPGGLRARLSHHLRRAVRPHLHIDYLRRGAMLVAVLYRGVVELAGNTPGREPQEHDRFLSASPGIRIQRLQM